MPMMFADDEDETKEYGQGVKVETIRHATHNEYRVCVGNFAVKNFGREDEADTHAKRLAKDRQNRYGR